MVVHSQADKYSHGKYIYYTLKCTFYTFTPPLEGAGMAQAQRLCNGLLRVGPGSIPSGYGVKTELRILRKGQ